MCSKVVKSALQQIIQTTKHKLALTARIKKTGKRERVHKSLDETEAQVMLREDVCRGPPSMKLFINETLLVLYWLVCPSKPVSSSH
ncbi:hypothetical protein EUGRSUZ_K01328 [Eucalyptus grandis]|uniref:Uncharacterized protein n=2 Tax=Eucalyptus grandis TaxID=71139 RepID=A0ACC3IU07_EUCGR|nr:hypothetical protein EUGRSUZ_K01328 [Eucalyptus grandis]